MQHRRNTRPARRSAPPLSRSSSSIFAALANKTRFVDPALAARWPFFVGESLKELCRPGRITGAGAERTIEVHVPNGAAATKVQMQTDAIIRNLNAYLGPNAVARLALRQAGGQPIIAARPSLHAKKEPAGANPALADDNASPLGSALASFRSAIARRESDK